MSRKHSCALLLASALGLSAPAAAVITPGDINDDGSIDQADVDLLSRHIAGEIALGCAESIAANVVPVDANLDPADLGLLTDVVGEVPGAVLPSDPTLLDEGFPVEPTVLGSRNIRLMTADKAD